MAGNNQACCAHDHDCEAADCGPAYSLHKHINFAGVRLPSTSSLLKIRCSRTVECLHADSAKS